MHGLDQSQALSKAAVALSEAREQVEVVKMVLSGDLPAEYRDRWIARLASAKDARTAARAAYDAAYKMYTNPFGVVKTFS